MNGKTESPAQVATVKRTTVSDKIADKPSNKVRPATKEQCTAGICSISWKPIQNNVTVSLVSE